ncbi:hypothetical protein WN51_08147 [Melipona quadrifasciata]|uniref:Uncharacterized protein n=1 Tax=Melipona quadrifasciata TaxID=166423 RepID=A0A0M8ZNI7_9HYME|nr:hypothetical protein WN51_08147 [Melipona quadrifasciata]
MHEILRQKLVFQYDSAPLHYATGVRNWLNNTLNNKLIGRGGCDFFLWGYLKEQIFQIPIANTNELRRKITAACKTISPEKILAEVANNFLK